MPNSPTINHNQPTPVMPHPPKLETTEVQTAQAVDPASICSRNLTPAQREVMRVLREESDARIMGDYISKSWRLIHACKNGGFSQTRAVRDAMVQKLIEGGHIVRTADHRGRRVYIENNAVTQSPYDSDT